MTDSNAKLSSQQVLQTVSEYLQTLRKSIASPVRIREEELADRLGVSRTPVREALIRLDTTGLVSLRPGKGALLEPVTDADYLEWLQIREQLEGLATREAALNSSQRDVDGLRQIFAPFKPDAPACSAVDYAKANVQFHHEIVRLSSNTLLNKLWLSFGHLQTSFRRQTISKLHRQDDSLTEHFLIIDAIERRDAKAAENLARAHVQSLAIALALAQAQAQAAKTMVAGDGA
jgi:DNA-binding GntR family transcriptional regulator